MSSTIVGRPIVVGIDGSASALHAARWAAEEAAFRRVPLRLVHGVHVPVSAAAYIGRMGVPTSFFEILESDGRRYLADAEAAVHQAHPEVEVDVDLLRGYPVPVLISLSQAARLMVLGSRGLGGFSGLLAGSTAVALVGHGHCPVAVIHGPASEGAPPAGGPVGGPVVVGVDGSPASEAAIAMAFEEASLRNVDLVAVHTWLDFSSDYSYAYARQFMVDWKEIEIEAQELLAQRLAGWQEKYPDVTVKRVVTRDRPAHHLLERANQAQLLVVGSRGRGGMSGVLLGSTSQALIYHSPCPLLVVRPVTAP
jgi:nucleotide-binding universal stress UspA family protein